MQLVQRRVTVMRIACVLLVALSGCVTAADMRRADNEDQLCWMRYRQMVRRGSATVDGDVQIEGKRLSCLALDRRLEHLSENYHPPRQRETRRYDDDDGPSGGEIAAGIFHALGSAMGGAAAAGAATRQPATCTSVVIGGTMTTTCQ